jgi:hypothetical protein
MFDVLRIVLTLKRIRGPGKELVIVRTGPAAGYFPKIIEEWDNSYLFNRLVEGIEPGTKSSGDDQAQRL